MPTDANYLSVALRERPTVDVKSTGLNVLQMADGTGNGRVDFKVDGDALGWDYDSSLDTVWLVESSGRRTALSRVGDFWRWAVGATDLYGSAITPGGTGNRTCWIEVQRGTGATTTGPFTRYASADFTITLDRQIGINPFSIGGCVAYYDNWDFASTAPATTVTTWDDKSPVDRDLVEATNPPLVRFDDLGQPYIEFDGSNDELETVPTDIPGLGSGLAQTIVMVARHRSNSGTDDLFQAGGTNGGRLDYDGTNARGMAGADAASTTAAGVGAWAVYTVTKDGTNVTVQKNLVAEVSTASAGAIAAGTLVLGRSTVNATAFAAFDIKKLAVFNSDLSQNDTDLLVRAWAAECGISI